MTRPPVSFRLLFLIATGGALGSLTRYAVSLALPGHCWPTATWLTNIIGCGLFGVVIGLSLTRFPDIRWLRPLLTTGFLGGFTTFSTFIFEAHQLPPLTATSLAITSVAFSVGACWAGYRLTTRFTARPDQTGII